MSDSLEHFQIDQIYDDLPEQLKTNDVFFLMEKYKEDHDGLVTTDICVLF